MASYPRELKACAEQPVPDAQLALLEPQQLERIGEAPALFQPKRLIDALVEFGQPVGRGCMLVLLFEQLLDRSSDCRGRG
jgi:hypothetical protein